MLNLVIRVMHLFQTVRVRVRVRPRTGGSVR